MAAPAWTSMVQVVEIRMPGAEFLLPLPTCEVVMVAPARTWSGLAPRSNEANHVAGVGPDLSKEKREQRSESPTQEGGLVLKSARTF